MTAEEARKIAEENTIATLEMVYEAVRKRAEVGGFEIRYNAYLSFEIRHELMLKGFLVNEYTSGKYEISWNRPS